MISFMETDEGKGWKRPGMHAADYGLAHDHDHDKRIFAGKGPRGYRRPDTAIKEEACERLKWDPDVDASEIEVSAENGVVYLTGQVDSRHAKRRAELVLDTIKGLHDVQNQLTIKPVIDLVPEKAVLRGDDGFQSKEVLQHR